ncbi:hypothetical protein FRB96_007425 [Tulasnella sp. 330]|nr:hypothetical protein FRB96_007425 [Tulasnella sp. 330]
MTISIQTSDAISVVSEDVKAHLSLLGAFSKLREAHHARWPAYVKQCVAKFHDWIQKLGVLPDRDPTRVLERNLPDLDVLMVWHTYLLNPVRYHRDSTDSSNALHNLGAFPLSASAKQLADLRRDTLSASPSITHGIGDIKNDIDKFDLVAAVLRQSEFIKKIEALGWTELPSSNQLVSNSILRYCVFLELLANGAVQSLVPTLSRTGSSYLQKSGKPVMSANCGSVRVELQPQAARLVTD